MAFDNDQNNMGTDTRAADGLTRTPVSEPPQEFVTRAAYNFVPFPEEALTLDPSTLPRHDVLDPKLHSGEIHVTLRAETPVFVSDGKVERDPVDGTNKPLHFFKDGQGRYAIPGSSLRGLLRENCQILGLGRVRSGEDFDDYHISYRATGDGDKELRKYYDTVMDSVQEVHDGRKVSIARNGRAGYLYTKDGKSYQIYPVDKSQIQHIPRNSSGLDALRACMDRNGRPKYADRNGELNEQLIPVNVSGSGRSIRLTPGAPGRSAMLLCTGRPVNGKNSHYLFPPPQLLDQGIPVPPDDILDYQADFEARSTVLHNKDAFWKLPGEKNYKGPNPKPVFYVEYNGHIFIGMSQFVRIAYPYRIGDGLPAAHHGKTNGLDYAHAMFGFIGKGKYAPSYRSRISVGDFSAVGGVKEGAPYEAVLGGPKPSWYYGYLQPNGRYLDPDFRLRGYKQYWLKPTQQEKQSGKNRRVATRFCPLPRGTQFSGVIRFRNLSDMELGLLLWSIRLNEGCRQIVGMAKPLGFGRMAAQIDRLLLLEPQRSYADLSASPWDDATERISAFIDAFDANALRQIGKQGRISEREDIHDFFFLRSQLRNPKDASHLELTQFKSVRKWLPTVRDIRDAH